MLLTSVLKVCRSPHELQSCVLLAFRVCRPGICRVPLNLHLLHPIFIFDFQQTLLDLLQLLNVLSRRIEIAATGRAHRASEIGDGIGSHALLRAAKALPH
jgi:hypothetical protein